MTDIPLASSPSPAIAPSGRRPLGRWRKLANFMLFGPQADRPQKAKARLVLAMMVFGGVFAVIGGRLVQLAVFPEFRDTRAGNAQQLVAHARPEIRDRNGEVLAIDVKTASLYAEPRRMIDIDEAVESLSRVLPDLDRREVRERLRSRRGFVWIRREVTAEQERAIHRLGIPGIGFLRENRRVYPNRNIVSHIMGHTNIDNEGIAGLEKYVDTLGLAELHRAGFAVDRDLEPVTLSLDLRIQHVMRDELIAARERFKAKAAAGILIDVRTGEIHSMVSVPDYDPNKPEEAMIANPNPRPNQPARIFDPAKINRLTTGTYEMGSTFKALTVAMALDSGRFNLTSMFDARAPLQYGRFTINDFHPQRRILDTAEVFVHSSNIGTARMALALGVNHHREFLRRLGQLDRLRTELPESAAPQVPANWGEINTVTISFGHGLAVAPLQAVAATAALVNGGYLMTPTFVRRTEEEAMANAVRVVSPQTSQAMRYLMRLNAEFGTAKRADVPGFYVGGKTGTSEKSIGGRYVKNRLLTTFMAIFPSDRPQYLLLVMLDEPQGTPETQGFATAGWNASPTAGRIIARAAPILGLQPRFELPPANDLIMARAVRPFGGGR